MKKRFSSEFKAQVALEALKELKTINEWKKQLKGNLHSAFSQRANSKQKQQQEHIQQLEQKVGQLTIELDWLKKKLPRSTSQRKLLVEAEQLPFSISRQCQLLNIPRSSYYAQPATESAKNLEIMHLIDQIHTQFPFYGRRRIKPELEKNMESK